MQKTLDVTPYEYGKKIGNLFALTWDKEAGIADYMGCEITREDTKQSSRITIKKK